MLVWLYVLAYRIDPYEYDLIQRVKCIYVYNACKQICNEYTVMSIITPSLALFKEFSCEKLNLQNGLKENVASCEEFI